MGKSKKKREMEERVAVLARAHGCSPKPEEYKIALDSGTWLYEKLGKTDELIAGGMIPDEPPQIDPKLLDVATKRHVNDCVMDIDEACRQSIPLLDALDVKYGGIHDGDALRLAGDIEIDQMLRAVVTTLTTKGAEYTVGSPDRLANFKKEAARLRRPGLPIEMQDIWSIYVNKHLSAIESYIRNGCTVQSNEPISGRIMDVIVYMLLFHKMSLEIERQCPGE